MSRIRVGMIGTGGIAEWHGRQLLELSEVEIVAIADTSEKSRETFTGKFELSNVREFADYGEMLDQAEMDAVVICSPHTLHFKQAADVLNRGLHV